MGNLQQTYNAVKQVLGERKYVFLFLLFALFLFALFVFIPVATTPGNTIMFQLSIFRSQDYFLMIFLALLAGLNFSMNIYAYRQKKRLAAASGFAVNGVTAGIGGIFAAIAGTASCASCLSLLFSVIGLGFGSVIFVLEYQIFFILGAIALVVISLYFTARKINKICSSC